MRQIGLSEKYICSEQMILAWADMTLILDLQFSFKTTAHPLSKSTLWVRFEPDWAEGIEEKLLTSDLGWTD